ncbi:MAG: ABC transporter permease [Bdellovibrionota bacterium]
MKFVSFASLLCGLIIWQIFSLFQLVDSTYFPPPTLILQRAWILLVEQGDFREHIISSLQRLLLGQLIAFPLAFILALASTLNKLFRAALSPWVSLIYPIPKLALFPFFLILLGTGDSSKIAMIALGSFFLMYLSFELGLRRIYESEYFEIVRVYRISRLKIFWHIFFKGALPEIINGIKMGFGYGLVLMVGSEMTMSKNGLGFYMWNSWDQFQILNMYACLFWISFLGIISFRFFNFVERNAVSSRIDPSNQ